MNLDAAGESAAMLVSTGRNTDHLPGSGHGDPNMLLDALRDRMKVKNDAALCRALGVPPPVISKIRHRRLPVGVTILVRMHEKSGLSIQELQRLLGNGENK